MGTSLIFMWDLWLHNLMSSSCHLSVVTRSPSHCWPCRADLWGDYVCLINCSILRAQHITDQYFVSVCCCFSFQRQERTEPWKLLIRVLVLQTWCWLHASMPCPKSIGWPMLFAFDTSPSLCFLFGIRKEEAYVYCKFWAGFRELLDRYPCKQALPFIISSELFPKERYQS